MKGKGTFLKGVPLLSLLLVTTSIAWGESREESGARQKLAAKLLKLSQSLDMKEARYPDSKGGGGKDFNANDGNSFTSNTTYHSYTWDYCLQWVGPRNCSRWLDPYVSKHGADGDRSPLEGVVWEEYLKRKPEGQAKATGNGQYAIWQIKARGDEPFDAEGRLDRTQITDMRLLPDVAQKVSRVGEDTAQRQINLTYDQDSGGEPVDTMPNMESLREMASRWTRMFRNRLVANMGEIRASEKNIEFALDEGAADCDQYLAALRTELDRTRMEERRDAQANLDIETRTRRLEERYNLCQQMRQASVYAPNLQAKNGQIESADPNLSKVDEWRNRLNIAAIDFVGLNVEALPKPADAQIAKEDITQEMTAYADGGRAIGNTYKTNIEQIEGYNSALQSAAQGYAKVAARSPLIRDNGAEALKYQIQPLKMNLVQINGITPEMKAELSDTGFPRLNGGPENYLEQTAAEVATTGR